MGINTYIELQHEVDRAHRLEEQVRQDALRISDAEFPQAEPDPVGEWAAFLIVVAIALLGSWLAGWHL